MRYLNIFSTQGTDFWFYTSVIDANQNPIDITGVTFSAAACVSFTDSSTRYPITVSITNAALGQIVLNIPAAVTLTVPIGNFDWQIFMTLNGVTSKLFTGVLTMKAGLLTNNQQVFVPEDVTTPLAYAIVGSYSYSFASQTSFTVTHNLNSTLISYKIVDLSSNPIVAINSLIVDPNNLTINLSVSSSGIVTVYAMVLQ